MPNNISVDEIFGASQEAARPQASADTSAPQSISVDDIFSAQDAIDAVPRDRMIQGDVGGLGMPSGEFTATGPDRNVQRGNAGFVANLKAGMVEDPRTKIGIFARSIFPDDPAAEKRFGIRDGEIVYIDDDLNVRSVDSGFTGMAGKLVSQAPEAIGAIAGSIATASPVIGGSLGAMGGKGVKQMIAGTLFDDPQTTAGNLGGMASEGVINLATGGLAKGAGALLNKGKVADFTPRGLSAASAVRDQVRNSTGITLDLAQASGQPDLLALRKYAAKFPGESSQIFRALDEVQTGQTVQATQRVMDLVARQRPADVLGADGMNAARATIRAARTSVSQQVDPLYEAAYASKTEISNPRFLSMLKLPYFSKAYEQAKTRARLEGIKYAEDAKPDLRLMDYTKQALDDLYELEAGKSPAMARAIARRREEFVGFLDNVSNAQYQHAREEFGRLTDQYVRPLEEGAVGAIARTTNPRAATAAAKMFTDPNITAEQIRFARSAIEPRDPDAWNGLVRQYLGSVLNESMKVTQRGETVNLAGKLYQGLAGTPEQLARLREALPSQAQAPLTDLLEGLRRVASTDRGGSDTAFNQLLTRKVEGRFSSWLKMLRQPVQTVIQSGDEKSLNAMVVALGEGLTDPARISQLRQIRKISPGAERSIQVLSTMLGGPAAREAEDEIFPMADQPIGTVATR